MLLKKIALASVIAITAGTTASACEIAGRVSIVGNEFPAIHAVADGAKACSGSEVKANLTADHQKINVAGMSGNPAEYTSAIVANSSIVALMNEDVSVKFSRDGKKDKLNLRAFLGGLVSVLQGYFFTFLTFTCIYKVK